MKGWISLHRSITEHWVWKDSQKLKWWLDILLQANHEGNKVNVGMQLIDCGRGQCVLSLKNWSERWGVSRDTVRNFLTLLKSDAMITTENLTKSTRITICNYESYQGTLRDDQTQTKRKPSAGQTLSDINNNSNNKENKEISPNGDTKKNSPEFSNVNEDFSKFDDWLKRNAPYCSNEKNFTHQITEGEFLKLKERYTGNQIADIIEQIENRKDLRRKYTNLYKTVLNWAKREYGDK